MKRVSDRFLQLAVLGGVLGMALGAWMGRTENFVLAPAHAHINLLIWVSMMLYGLFYRVVPRAATGPLPTLHFALNVLGVVIMLPSLVILLLAQSAGKPVLGISVAQAGMFTGISSIVVWVSMLLFLIIVWRATWKAEPAV